MNKNNIIVINNKHYDAQTGVLLTQRSPRTEEPVRGTRRKPAKHTSAHPPRHSQTLMRQAVKKPPVGLKRRIRAQSHIDSPGSGLVIGGVVAEPPFKQLDARLLAYAQRLKESSRISHFSPTVSDVVSHMSPSSQANQPRQVTIVQSASTSKRPLHSKKPKTTAELLDYAVQQATSHEQKLAKQHRRKLFKRHASV